MSPDEYDISCVGVSTTTVGGGGGGKSSSSSSSSNPVVAPPSVKDREVGVVGVTGGGDVRSPSSALLRVVTAAGEIVLFETLQDKTVRDSKKIISLCLTLQEMADQVRHKKREKSEKHKKIVFL